MSPTAAPALMRVALMRDAARQADEDYHRSVVEARSAGASIRAIARAADTSLSQVQRILAR